MHLSLNIKIKKSTTVFYFRSQMKSESQIRRIFAHNENLSFAYLWQPAHIEYAVQVHVLSLLACMWCIIQSFIAASPFTWAGVKQFYLVPEAFWHDEIIQCHKVAGMSHPWHVVASRQWWQWWLSRPTCWFMTGLSLVRGSEENSKELETVILINFIS